MINNYSPQTANCSEPVPTHLSRRRMCRENVSAECARRMCRQNVPGQPLILNHTNGFSIIEVIVSCVILGIAVLGFMNFFPTSSTINARADRRNEAGVLAEDKIEELRIIGFEALEDTIALGDTTGTNTIGNIIRTWTIRDSNNIIIADVNCIWRTPGAPGHSNLRIMTQIANYE